MSQRDVREVAEKYLVSAGGSSSIALLGEANEKITPEQGWEIKQFNQM